MAKNQNYEKVTGFSRYEDTDDREIIDESFQKPSQRRQQVIGP